MQSDKEAISKDLGGGGTGGAPAPAFRRGKPLAHYSSSWAFGPPKKQEKLYAPSPQPSPPMGKGSKCFDFLVFTGYRLLATGNFSEQSAPPRAAAPIIKARTAEGSGSTKTFATIAHGPLAHP